MSQPSTALPIGTPLNYGQYRVEKVLGQGGFGITYLAQDLNIGTPVAIKELFLVQTTRRADGSLVIGSEGQADFARVRERFRLEAQTLSKLRHPAIVQVKSLFEANGTVYLVMEYLEGQTLEAAIRSRGRMSEAEVRAWMLPILQALEEVHSVGLLHRDLKPENIMLTAKGPVLIDFGAALELASTQTRYTVMYTPTYAPLEQLGSGAKLTPATDLYGLCATAYRCLSGTTPIPASDRLNGTLLPNVQHLNPLVSAGFAHLVEQSLALKAIERPQSAKTLLEKIQVLAPVDQPPADQEPPQITVLGLPQPKPFAGESDWDIPPAPSTSSWLKVAPWVGLAGLAAGGLMLWALMGRSPNQSTSPLDTEPEKIEQRQSPKPAPTPDWETTPGSQPSDPFPTPSPPPSGEVRLRLETNAPNARIVLNGQRLKVAETEAVGNRYRYEVRLKHSLQPQRLEVRAEGFERYAGQLALNRDRNLSVQLDRLQVWLRVYTNLPNAYLRLDGQTVDTRTVPSAGRYVLEVRRPYSTQLRLIELRAAGYRPIRRAVVFDQERRLELAMQSLPRANNFRPKPNPQARTRRPAQQTTQQQVPLPILQNSGCDVAAVEFCR